MTDEKNQRTAPAKLPPLERNKRERGVCAWQEAMYLGTPWADDPLWQEARVTAAQKVIVMALADRQARDGDGWSWMSMGQLAVLAGLSVGRISRSLDEPHKPANGPDGAPKKRTEGLLQQGIVARLRAAPGPRGTVPDAWRLCYPGVEEPDDKRLAFLYHYSGGQGDSTDVYEERLDLIRHARGGDVIGTATGAGPQVMPSAWAPAELDADPGTPVITHQIATMFGVNHRTVLEWVKRHPGFPSADGWIRANAHAGRRGVWRKSRVVAWGRATGRLPAAD